MTETFKGLVGTLRDGPLDIVGDIHGELEPLEELLRHLGYDSAGDHPDGRNLVFVGDFCDRGPDSPGVFAKVQSLVNAGKAQCILGNHELNLLRNAKKSGNGWYFYDDPAHQDKLKGSFANCRSATPESRASIRAFMESMPVALERNDLRVVHACWQDSNINDCRVPGMTATQLYDHFHTNTKSNLDELERKADAQRRQLGDALKRDNPDIPMQEWIGKSDEAYQMSSPLRIVTSGVERSAAKPFWSNNKWFFCDRVSWWNEYNSHIPVVFGHYWRWKKDPKPKQGDKGAGYQFRGIPYNAWLGPDKKAFCVDFSIADRRNEPSGSERKAFLGALRWPERELVFDNGDRIATE